MCISERGKIFTWLDANDYSEILDEDGVISKFHVINQNQSSKTGGNFRSTSTKMLMTESRIDLESKSRMTGDRKMAIRKSTTLKRTSRLCYQFKDCALFGKYAFAVTPEGALYQLDSLGSNPSKTKMDIGHRLNLSPKIKIRGISGSYGHCLAWDEFGKVYAWGSNTDCVLGVAKNLKRVNSKVEEPEPVEALKGTRVIKCLAGETCSMVLTVRGKIYYWGR